MRKVRHIAGIIVCLLLWTSAVLAQDVAFYTTISKEQVAVGERFTISFKLENADESIVPPPLADFRVVFGPSQSSNFSYTNGRTSRSKSVSYVLIAEEAGEFTIGPAKTQVGGDDYQTQPIKVKVTGRGQGRSPSSKTTKATPKPKKTENILIYVSADKRTAYEGEPVVLTYTLYSRYNNLTMGELEMPSLNGFWVEDYPMDQIKWAPQLEEINGYRYRKAVLRKRAVYPQKPGKLSTGTFDLTCYVNRSFFNPGQEISVTSNSVTIDVKPYPDNRPVDFSGVTGSFDIAASVDKKTVAPDEAIVFKLRVSGTGNLKLLNEPEVNFPPDFEFYEPKVKQSIKLGADGLTGYKEWEYLLIPRYPGSYEIPPIGFSYFDLRQKKYTRTASTGIPIAVTGETATIGGNGSASVRRSGPRQDVNVLHKDIRYIHTSALAQSTGIVFSPLSFPFWAVSGATGLLFGLALFIRKRREKIWAEADLHRHKKAGKVIQSHLRKAGKHLKHGDHAAFFDELHRSLLQYLADKFRVKAHEVNRQMIRQQLSGFDGGQTVADGYIAVLDGCEMARYSPQGAGDPEKLFDRANALIRETENRL